jgi:aryl sulfotransferase
MSRTVWLASYPKSGNTWFRLLLANLGRGTPVDINAIPLRTGMASARASFDAETLLPSGLLTQDECDRLRPRVYAALAAHENADFGDVRFVKTHDAWTCGDRGEPLLGGRNAADAAILIVRDPRAVAPSLASHLDVPLAHAIDFLADAASSFCADCDRQLPQLRQQLRGWSEFNRSWLEQRDLPVHLVRYETLAAEPVQALAGALAFVGIVTDTADCARAAHFADFSELRRQERAHGFREAPRSHAATFFRDGTTDGWRRTLSPAQVSRIESDHKAMMRRLGYRAAGSAAERLAG